jgi:hypothetical protein
LKGGSHDPLGWLFVGLFAGFGLLSAGHDEMRYRNGFVEGHTEGFQDGMKELGKVG